MRTFISSLFLATLLSTVVWGGCGGLEPGADEGASAARADQADEQPCTPTSCEEGQCVAGACVQGDPVIEVVLARATIASEKTHWDKVFVVEQGYLPDAFVMLAAAWVPEKQRFDDKWLMSSVQRDTMEPAWQEVLARVSASQLLGAPAEIKVQDWDEWNPLYMNDLLGHCLVTFTPWDLALGGLSVDCGKEGHLQDLQFEFSAAAPPASL